MSPFVTLYLRCPIIVEARVLFPEPFGPIIACISPCLTWKSTPFSISFPSMEACRSLISSWLNSGAFLLSLLRSVSRLVSFFGGFDKSGMTYVIFKGTKTRGKMHVSRFSADPRDDNPHLIASSNFVNVAGDRVRVSFKVQCHFSRSYRVGKPVTSHLTSQLRPDYC